MGVPPPLVGTQGENSVAVDHCALNEGNCLQKLRREFGVWNVGVGVQGGNGPLDSVFGSAVLQDDDQPVAVTRTRFQEFTKKLDTAPHFYRKNQGCSAFFGEVTVLSGYSCNWGPTTLEKP